MSPFCPTKLDSHVQVSLSFYHCPLYYKCRYIGQVDPMDEQNSTRAEGTD